MRCGAARMSARAQRCALRRTFISFAKQTPGAPTPDMHAFVQEKLSKLVGVFKAGDEAKAAAPPNDTRVDAIVSDALNVTLHEVKAFRRDYVQRVKRAAKAQRKTLDLPQLAQNRFESVASVLKAANELAKATQCEQHKRALSAIANEAIETINDEIDAAKQASEPDPEPEPAPAADRAPADKAVNECKEPAWLLSVNNPSAVSTSSNNELPGSVHAAKAEPDVSAPLSQQQSDAAHSRASLPCPPLDDVPVTRMLRVLRLAKPSLAADAARKAQDARDNAPPTRKDVLDIVLMAQQYTAWQIKFAAVGGASMVLIGQHLLA